MSIVRFAIISVCSLLAALSMTGCRTSGVHVENLGPTSGLLVSGEFKPDGNLLQPNSTPSKSHRDFVVTDVKGITTADGVCKVQVDIKNPRSKPVNLQYRVFWFDGNGMELPSTTVGWQPLQVFSKGTCAITSSAGSPQAHSFKVYVRNIEYKN